MTTRADLETELQSQLQAADNSTLYPASRLTTLIKNAYIWATQIAIWNDLVRGKDTTTKASGTYYDYPSEFRSETIIRIEVDGDNYPRRAFEDYLSFIDRNPSSSKKFYANFGRQFFIHPTPSTAGLEICVWGAIQADALSDSTSVPIFSYNKEEANQAVVRKALSVAVKRADPNLAQVEEREATVMLLRLAEEEQKATQRDQRLDRPMFDVPDYYGGNGATPYQRFNYLPEDF